MHSFQSLWIPPLHHCGITALTPVCLIQYLSSCFGGPCCESAPQRSLYPGTFNSLIPKGAVPTTLLPPWNTSSKKGKDVSSPSPPPRERKSKKTNKTRNGFYKQFCLETKPLLENAASFQRNKEG